MKRTAKGAAKEHILDVASSLFYTQGIRAIGIDTIVAQSAVAKTTLYDHFPSKDALITAYLEQKDAQFWQAFDHTLATTEGGARQQILTVFETIEAMIAAPESLGCPFLSAASEFPELDQPGHQVALAHKQQVRARLYLLAEGAGAQSPGLLADQLLLLLDGAFASKRVFRSADSPMQVLSATVKMLLDVHLA